MNRSIASRRLLSPAISMSNDTDVWPLASVTVQGPPDQSSASAVSGVAVIVMVTSDVCASEAVSDTVSVSPSSRVKLVVSKLSVFAATSNTPDRPMYTLLLPTGMSPWLMGFWPPVPPQRVWVPEVPNCLPDIATPAFECWLPVEVPVLGPLVLVEALPLALRIWASLLLSQVPS